MNRRSRDQRGYVKFPIDDNKHFTNSHEGGMFVRLVVTENRNHTKNDWMVSCGGGCNVIYDESLVGDDVHKDSEPDVALCGTKKGMEKFDRLMKEGKRTENFHFPMVNDDRYNPSGIAKEYNANDTYEQFLSRHYLAVVTLGSTGWSGWNEKEGHYFRCTYNDLTKEGKNLYNTIKKLYGDRCKLYLQTWLDT